MSHHFRSKVEELRQLQLLAGKPMTHAALLQAVAEANGASSWGDLPRDPPRGWFARAIGWDAPNQNHGHYFVDELLYDHDPSKLRLGRDMDVELSAHKARPKVDLHLSLACRGVLVVGPDGCGSTTAVASYMAQHVLHGGGVLVLDASANEWNAKLLQRVAQECGRDDFHWYRHDKPDGVRLTDVSDLVRQRGVAYVNLPWQDRPLPEIKETEQLIRQLVQVQSEAAVPSATGPKERPFMVVIAEGGGLLTEAWTPFFRYARALQLLPVLRLHSLGDLVTSGPELREAIMNLYTQLYLAPRSDLAMHLAVSALAPDGTPEHRAEVQGRLSRLGMGEVLSKTEGRPQTLKLEMVSAETTSEYRQRRLSSRG